VVLRDFEKDGSNVNADLWGFVHSKSIGDSAERALNKNVSQNNGRMSTLLAIIVDRIGSEGWLETSH
jgi:hypothetical protein